MKFSRTLRVPELADSLCPIKRLLCNLNFVKKDTYVEITVIKILPVKRERRLAKISSTSPKDLRDLEWPGFADVRRQQISPTS